jgi:hypothetical protein
LGGRDQSKENVKDELLEIRRVIGGLVYDTSIAAFAPADGRRLDQA